MKVSVIIPVYNVRACLVGGLESVCRAVRTALPCVAVEVLCVDDASTDGSGELLDGFVARQPEISVCHLPENRGVSTARNAGLDRATGDILMFADPDDVVAPDWIVRMVAALGDAEAVLAGYSENGCQVESRDMGATFVGNAVRERLWRAFFGYRLRDLIQAFLPGGLWKRCAREMAGVWRCAVRRSALGDLRFDTRLDLYEDAMFLSALGTRLTSLKIAGDCGYDWRVRPTGAMTRERRQRLVPNKFAVRDVRRELDPGMTHWRGTRVLSFLEIWRTAGLSNALRYLAGVAQST